MKPNFHPCGGPVDIARRRFSESRPPDIPVTGTANTHGNGLQGQVLWGKARAGMTPQEIASMEPDVWPVIELKKLADGAVARLCLPCTTVAGIKG